MTQPLHNKKIALLVAFKDFRDEELFIPQSVLQNEGAQVKVVSTQEGKALGSYGGVVEVDIVLNDFDVSQFDAIVFIGGSGAGRNINDEKHHQIARQASEKGKLLAAICIAPAILAKAGVLQGKKATVWSSQMDKSAVKILEQAGAEYMAQAVVVDNNIITANGPMSARKFAEAVVRGLTND